MAIHCSQGYSGSFVLGVRGLNFINLSREGGGSQHPLGPVERPTQKIVTNVKIASVKCLKKNKFAFNT